MRDTEKKQKILIVDDEPLNIRWLGEILRPDYDICVAINGKDALQLAFSEKPPDLVLLDIMMPMMDGYEVCRRLKSDVRTKKIPVIFITAKSGQEDEIKGFSVGGIDYITKPFAPDIAKARVQAHLKADFTEDTRAFHKKSRKLMGGSLEDVNLTALLQSMELELKTAHIELKDIDGEIFIQNGCFIYARQGAFSGDRAFAHMLLLEKGYFSVMFNCPPPKVSYEPKTLMSLLVNVLSYLEREKDHLSVPAAECETLIGRIKSVLISYRMSALLFGQRLSDSNKHKAALKHLSIWTDQWQKAGQKLLSAAGSLELSNLLAKKGEIKEAREYYNKALGLWPLWERMHVLNRPDEFVHRLQQSLYPDDINLTED